MAAVCASQSRVSRFNCVLPDGVSGWTISEIVEGVDLPPVGAEPYALVLEARACRWLSMSRGTAQFVPA